MMDKRMSLLLYGNAFEIRGPIGPAVSIDPRLVKVVEMPKGWRWITVTVQAEGAR